jgi:hypothetical protein
MGAAAEIVEALAAIEHEQWAHWTKHMLTVLEPVLRKPRLDDGEQANAAFDALLRWDRQIETPYAELTEAEKESDREWAHRVLACLGSDPELAVEALAALDHEQWGHWTQYMLQTLYPELFDGSQAVYPHPDVRLWMVRIRTPYTELPETERQSYREWAHRALSAAE